MCMNTLHIGELRGKLGKANTAVLLCPSCDRWMWHTWSEAVRRWMCDTCGA